MSASALKYAALSPTESGHNRFRSISRSDLQVIVRHKASPETDVVISAQTAEIFLDALELLDSGTRVALLGEDTELSPNEAAEVLGISRPLVVRRMEAGDLPFKLVGSHRRCLLRDVLAFKQKDEARRNALKALADDAGELNESHGL